MKALARLSAAEKWVLVMSALTLVLALANLGRAAVAMRYAAQIPGLETSMGLIYAATTGLFWGISLIVSTGGLLGAYEWGRVSTLITVTLYQAHVWLNRLGFDASDYARETRPRDMVLTAVLLLLYWGTLNLRPVQRVFTKDAGKQVRNHPRDANRTAAEKEIDRR